MSEKQMYILTEAEKDIRRRVSQHYSLKSKYVNLRMVYHSQYEWQVELSCDTIPLVVINIPHSISEGEELFNIADIDVAFQELMKQTAIRVNTLLIQMVHVKTKDMYYSDKDLILNWNTWKLTLTTCPLITTFFDVSIQKHPTKTHRIVTYTERYTGEQIVGYFKETKLGYTRCSSNQYEFAEMRDDIKTDIGWVESQEADLIPYLDQITGKIHLPRKGHGYQIYTYWDIIRQSHERIVVTFVRIKLEGQLRIKQAEFTVFRDTSGRPILKEVEIDLDWVKSICGTSDVFKNPLNTHIYQYLDPQDIPLYQGEYFFLTHKQGVYIRGMGDSWVPVTNDLDWILSHKKYVHKDVLGEIERYLLSEKLQN